MASYTKLLFTIILCFYSIAYSQTDSSDQAVMLQSLEHIESIFTDHPASIESRYVFLGPNSALDYLLAEEINGGKSGHLLHINETQLKKMNDEQLELFFERYLGTSFDGIQEITFSRHLILGETMEVLIPKILSYLDRHGFKGKLNFKFMGSSADGLKYLENIYQSELSKYRGRIQGDLRVHSSSMDVFSYSKNFTNHYQSKYKSIVFDATETQRRSSVKGKSFKKNPRYEKVRSLVDVFLTTEEFRQRAQRISLGRFQIKDKTPKSLIEKLYACIKRVR
jgi:hypothetical protein